MKTIKRTSLWLCFLFAIAMISIDLTAQTPVNRDRYIVLTITSDPDAESAFSLDPEDKRAYFYLTADTDNTPVEIVYGNIRNTIMVHSRERDAEGTQYVYLPKTSTMTIYGNVNGLNCYAAGHEPFVDLGPLDFNGGVQGPVSNLNISHNQGLKTLDCTNNMISLLDVSWNTGLEELNCSHNGLTTLDVSRNTALKVLDCSSNALGRIDVSRNTSLVSLSCSENGLSQIDVSRNTALKSLDCCINQLTLLDVSRNTDLTDLNCFANELRSIDVSRNTALTRLICSVNKLTTLDIRPHTALEELNCQQNKIIQLDLSQNTALKSLRCSDNRLTTLDLSTNQSLKLLQCYGNQLTAAALDRIYCALPDRTGKEPGELFPAWTDDLDDAPDPDKPKVLATNGRNATRKNWEILYKSNLVSRSAPGGEVTGFTGRYICGSGK
jgi:cell wall surface anchor family protein